ncbi:MAG: hypothetical protein ACTSRR_09325 [Candidatus Heimdallarchaeaceae archaeon]
MVLLRIISIYRPIKSHFETLRDDANWIIVIIVFFIIPMAFSSLLVFIGDILITELYVNVLIAAFAIFIGFFIDSLILLLGMEKHENDTDRNRLVIHTSYNTVYALILGIFILLFCLVLTLFFNIISDSWLIALSFIFHSFVGHFIVTLFMIARRLYYAVFLKSSDWDFEGKRS